MLASIVTFFDLSTYLSTSPSSSLQRSNNVIPRTSLFESDVIYQLKTFLVSVAIPTRKLPLKSNKLIVPQATGFKLLTQLLLRFLLTKKHVQSTK